MIAVALLIALVGQVDEIRSQAPNRASVEDVAVFELDRPTEEFASADPSDAQLRALWAKLDPKQRRAVVEYLDLDLAHAETFQLGLARWVVRDAGIDPGLLDAAPAETWFDPVVHAPAQPIPRTLLAVDAKRAVATRAAMAASFPARPADPAYRYDWGTRRVLRVAPADDPTRRFDAALAGMPREWDLVEAYLERALDDGSQTTAHLAFGHLYSERDGTVHPGITLYDAWGSGAGIEMPDVDVLGIVHVIANDYRTWVAPVPAAKQAPLYERISGWYVFARRQRGLREALARTYLAAEPTFRDGYTAGNHAAFHALWDQHASVPAALGAVLPRAEGFDKFIAATNERLAADRPFWAAGQVRQKALARDQAFIKQRLLAILRDLELLAAAPTKSGR